MAVKELKVFDQKAYNIVRAIADTIIPPGGAFDVDPKAVDPVLLLDNYIDSLSALQLKAIRAIISTIEYAPMVTRLRRFTKMSPGQRLRYLQGWENSRIFSKRNIFLLLKMLIMMSYYSDDAVAEAIQYHPECLIKD